MAVSELDILEKKEPKSAISDSGIELEHKLLKPLKIGVYGIRTIPSTYGGYETFNTVLLPELVARGHDVTLYAREKLGRRESYKGVKKIGLPSIATKQLDTISHSMASALVARFSGFDVVLSFNVANAPSLTFLSKTGVPTVLNVDGVEWERGKWGKLAKKVFYWCAKVSKHTSTRLIADCDAMKQIYKDEFGAESQAIPYCWTGLIDPEEMDTPDTEYLNQFGLMAKQYCITGGRFIPENNIAEIVESYVNSDSDMPMVVLGTANYDSPVRKQLVKLAQNDERVKLLGHIDDRRGFGILLRDAHVYFHGHSVGGTNPALIEAMGVGALVCALDTPFNREALDSCGLYFKSPEQAVQEYKQALRNVDTSTFRTLGKQRIQELYSLKTIVDKYEDILLEAAFKS